MQIGSRAMQLAFVLALFLLATPASAAMRCGSKLVRDGSMDYQVRAMCGDPFWNDHYVTLEILDPYGPYERQQQVEFDAWYYNFGPRQLMHRLLFRNGQLAEDATLGYGVSEIGTECAPAALAPRMSAGEVIARCGAPAARHFVEDTLIDRTRGRIEHWTPQRRETWIYDFGEGHRLRQLELRGGVVERVDAIAR